MLLFMDDKSRSRKLVGFFPPASFFFLLLQLSFHRITGIWAKEIVHVDLTFFLPSFSLSLYHALENGRIDLTDQTK